MYTISSAGYKPEQLKVTEKDMLSEAKGTKILKAEYLQQLSSSKI